MGEIADEVKLWNTPTIGAYLLWRFTVGYCNQHPDADAPIGLLHFVATAILTNKDLIKPISDMRANLQSYVNSFEGSKKMDILLSIQERAYDKRQYTLDSIDIANMCGLLAWDHTTGKLYPRAVDKKLGRGKAPKEACVREGNKAEILGKWFAMHDLTAISKYLKVTF